MKRVVMPAIAASALLGLPALAASPQTSSDRAGSVPPAMSVPAQLPGKPAGASTSSNTAAPIATTTAPATGQLANDLRNAGATQESQVLGTVYQAQTSDGLPVIVVVAPQDLQSQLPSRFDSSAFTRKLDQAGFKNPRQISGANIVHGMMNNRAAGDQQAILAMSDLNLQNKGNENSGHFDRNRFSTALKSAGIKADTPFKATLATAQGPDGRVLIVIGDQDLVARPDDQQAKIDTSAFGQSFEKGGMKNFSVVDNAHLYQGTTGGNTVFVIAGSGLAS